MAKVPPIPYQSPVTEPDRKLTPTWNQYLTLMFEGVGTTTTTITADLTALTAAVVAAQATATAAGIAAANAQTAANGAANDALRAQFSRPAHMHTSNDIISDVQAVLASRVFGV